VTAAKVADGALTKADLSFKAVSRAQNYTASFKNQTNVPADSCVDSIVTGLPSPSPGADVAAAVTPFSGQAPANLSFSTIRNASGQFGIRACNPTGSSISTSLMGFQILVLDLY
jgi:hypothetical protein